jgi:hypothetical protein
MKLKQFAEDYRDAISIASGALDEPENVEVMVRMADGTEFSPATIKVRVGKIIICAAEDSNGK